MHRLGKDVDRTDGITGTCGFCLSVGMAALMDVPRRFPDNQTISYTQIITRMFVIRLDNNPMKLICRKCEEKLHTALNLYRLIVKRQKEKKQDRVFNPKKQGGDDNDNNTSKQKKVKEYRPKQRLHKTEMCMDNVDKTSQVNIRHSKVDELVKLEIDDFINENDTIRLSVETLDEHPNSCIENNMTALTPEIEELSEILPYDSMVAIEIDESGDEKGEVNMLTENLDNYIASHVQTEDLNTKIEKSPNLFFHDPIKVEVDADEEQVIKNHNDGQSENITVVIEYPASIDYEETIHVKNEAQIENTDRTLETAFIKSEIKNEIQNESSCNEDSDDEENNIVNIEQDINIASSSNQIMYSEITEELDLPIDTKLYNNYDDGLNITAYEVPLEELLSFENAESDITETKLQITDDWQNSSSPNNKKKEILANKDQSVSSVSYTADELQYPILQKSLKFNKTYGNKTKASDLGVKESASKKPEVIEINDHENSSQSESADQSKSIDQGGQTVAEQTKTRNEKYTCDICGKHFASKFHFSHHYKICKTKPKPGAIKCSFCPMLIRGKFLDVSCHMRSAHGLKTFIKRKDEQTPGTSKETPKKEVCSVCDRKFDNSRSLSLHMAKSHPFQCDICGKLFSLNIDMQMHKTAMHAATFQCVECNDVFVKRKDKITHERLQHGSKQIECKHCDYVGYSQSYMTRHLRLMHGGKKAFKTF